MDWMGRDGGATGCTLQHSEQCSRGAPNPPRRTSKAHLTPPTHTHNTTHCQINAWFIHKRNPDTGAYPDFPDPSDGGSKLILSPPLPTIEGLIAAAAEGADGGGKKGAKGAKGKGSSAATKKSGDGAATGKGADKKGAGGKEGDGTGGVEETIGSAFVPLIEASVAEYVAKWQVRGWAVRCCGSESGDSTGAAAWAERLSRYPAGRCNQLDTRHHDHQP